MKFYLDTPLQEMPALLSLKKEKFETWHIDYSGFGIKIILFEWTDKLQKNFLSTDDRKMCFFNTTKKL